MKIKRISALSSSLVLSLGSLLALTGGVASAAGNNCTWAGGTSGNFNSASHWTNCNSTVPQNGDNLVFDNTSLTGDAAINNDLTGLSVGSITFQGNNASNYSFTITGNALSLSGGITETSSSTTNSLEVDLTLTADQTFSDTSGTNFGLSLGNTSLTNTLDLGSHTLTLDSGFGGSLTGIININSKLSGSGNIVANDATAGHGVYDFVAPTTNFSGKTTLSNGQIYIYDPAALGTSQITIATGAALNGEFSGTSNTFANPITMGGTGISNAGALVFDDACPTGGGACGDTGTTTLSGPMTLTANTTVGAKDTVDVTGAITGNFTLTLAPGYSGHLNVGAGTGTSSPTASTATAPKAPNTGTALIKSSILLPAFGGLLAASGLYIISRKLKQSSN